MRLRHPGVADSSHSWAPQDSKKEIKSAETDAIQIKGPQREEKGANKESGNRSYIDQGPVEESLTLKGAETEAILINGPLREEKGDNKERGHRG